jgi:hypothetical protein
MIVAAECFDFPVMMAPSGGQRQCAMLIRRKSVQKSYLRDVNLHSTIGDETVYLYSIFYYRPNDDLNFINYIRGHSYKMAKETESDGCVEFFRNSIHRFRCSN